MNDDTSAVGIFGCLIVIAACLAAPFVGFMFHIGWLVLDLIWH